MEIQELVNKYNDKIEALEREIIDTKNKRDTLLAVLKDAQELFNESTISSEKESTANNIAVISSKYSNMTWPDALLLALRDNVEMTGPDLLTHLLENGFESASKSKKSDMYGRLKQLEEKGKVIAIKEGKGLTKYKIQRVRRRLDFGDEQKEIDSDSHMPNQSRLIS